MEPWVICPFQPEDQIEAKELVLLGLEEHWGSLDPAYNHDLNDIAAVYSDCFVMKRVILETTESWKEVVTFYLALGFCITHRVGDDVYFCLEL